MSKLNCKCGYTIVDNSDNLSYKADMLPDALFYTFFDQLSMSIDQFISTCESGSLKEYLINHLKAVDILGVENEPLKDILYNVVSNYIYKSSKQVYQCTNCNRIWIQKNKSDKFLSFMPEEFQDTQYQNVLAFPIE